MDLPHRIGRFLPIRELGAGAMGCVIEAHDPDLDRVVAVKVLQPHLVSDPLRRARFVREAQIAGHLDHPGILPVYELGEHEGAPFLAMRKVEGIDLRVLLRRRAKDPEFAAEWPQHELIRRFSSVCRAMAYAHDRQIVHRDLKPGNLMFGRFGETLVLDWGIAFRLDQFSITAAFSPVDPAHQVSGSDESGANDKVRVVGTPGYFSPQQARGMDPAPADDVWSLGSMLYEIVTGDRAVPGDTVMSRWHRTLHKEVAPPQERRPGRHVPVELAEICMRALAKEVDDRYGDAGAMAEALDDYLAGSQRRSRAAAHLTRAEGAWFRFLELRQEFYGLEARERALESSLPPWASVQEKAELLAARRSQRLLETDIWRSFNQLVDGCERAISQDPDSPGAHELLASAHYTAFEHAEKTGDPLQLTYHRERCLAHDDGTWRPLIEAPGRLTLDTTPSGAEVWCEPIDKDDLVWLPGTPSRLGRTPLAVDLPPGSYRLRLAVAGHHEAIYPLALERQQSWEGGTVRLPTEGELLLGFVYVPGGPARLGSSPPVETNLPGFLITRLPVTMIEWSDFLNDLPLEQAWKHVPRAAGSAGVEAERLWARPGPGERFVVPETDADGDPWDPRWPVFNIDQADAIAFCEWRARRTGMRIRLPTAQELEKAGRGVDGRIYPWGDEFDSSMAKTSKSRPGRRLPEPVGEFAGDESIYGVRDLAGGVQEWCSSRSDEDGVDLVDVFGGAWNLGAISSRLDRTWRAEPWEVSSQVGFRMVCELAQ